MIWGDHLKQLISFLCALKGIIYTLLNESHFRFEIITAIYVIFFSIKFYSLSNTSWAILIIVIFLVLISETFNTAIEKVCDMITTKKNNNIKIIKDVSAGAVLLSAILSVITAFFILFDIETFEKIITYYSAHIFNFILLICTIVIAVLLLLIKPKKGKNK